MKIKALKRFQDYKENVVREVGDEFEVTEERLEEIKTGLAKFGEGDWVDVIISESGKGDSGKKGTPGILIKEIPESEPKPAPKKTNTTKGKA